MSVQPADPKAIQHLSIVCLPSFCFEGALLQEIDRDDLRCLLTIDGLPARWTVADSAFVVLFRCHQGPDQAFVAEDVACVRDISEGAYQARLHI